MTSTRSWAEMLAGIEQRLHDTTGDDVATWNDRVRTTALDTEPEARSWLAEATSVGNGDCTVRVGLTGVEEVDDEVVDLLAATWGANL